MVPIFKKHSRILICLLLIAMLAVSATTFAVTHAAPASVTSSIVSIANANVGKLACSTNSAGGKGYYTSCTGAGGAPELWCSDFAHWVWAKAGAYTNGLSPAAGSFGLYGSLHSTPQVGDAVLFDYNGNGYADHVALVVSVNSTAHTIVTIGGDEGNTGPGSTHVHKDGPYSDHLGFSSFMGQSISGYVSPRSAMTKVVAAPGAKALPAGKTFPTKKWTVSTSPNAPASYNGSKDGTLLAGTNYVYCKEWGSKVGSS
ncbi:MAG TPA: CHAP domain-containing protein, partial [Ktedonobacteraceae bacterium]